MKEQRIRAVSISKWIVLSLLTVIAFFCFQLGILPATIENKIMIFVCGIITIPALIYHLLHATFISEKGVEYCRLGKVIRTIAWENAEDICIIRDYKLAAGIMGQTRIVFVPAGCEKYDSKNRSGIHYLLTFRDRVIWIDNTKRNRQIIEERYGEISDFRFR